MEGAEMMMVFVLVWVCLVFGVIGDVVLIVLVLLLMRGPGLLLPSL